MNQEIDKIEPINQMNSKWRIYSRNSFDRFGDDSCELLLSYLSLRQTCFQMCIKTVEEMFVWETKKKTYIFIQESKLYDKSVVN